MEFATLWKGHNLKTPASSSLLFIKQETISFLKFCKFKRKTLPPTLYATPSVLPSTLKILRYWCNFCHCGRFSSLLVLSFLNIFLQVILYYIFIEVPWVWMRCPHCLGQLNSWSLLLLLGRLGRCGLAVGSLHWGQALRTARLLPVLVFSLCFMITVQDGTSPPPASATKPGAFCHDKPSSPETVNPHKLRLLWCGRSFFLCVAFIG